MARRTRASDSLQPTTAPSRSDARPATFENVLATNRWRNLRIQGTAVKPENSQRIVSAVGEKKFFRTNAEVAGQARCWRLIFRVHCQLLGGELCECAPHCGRAASRILIEVQPHLVRTAFRGRFICAAIQNRLSHWQVSLHRRTLTALR